MEYNLISKMNALLTGATSAHTEVMGIVEQYRSDYYNTPFDLRSGKRETTISMALVKDVLRSVEGALPSLVAPFIEKDIAVLESDTDDEIEMEAVKRMEQRINYYWNKKSNPLETIETLARNVMIDGTSWTKVGWNSKGYPTVENVPFESVIPDPSAYKQEDMRFVIHRRKVTVSDILANPRWFGKHTMESLNPLVPTHSDEYEPSIEGRKGSDDTFDMGIRSHEQIEIFEFYGEYDVDGSGVNKPVVIIWSNNMLLNQFDSPYDGFSIPFDAGIYLQRAFSIYGSGLPELISEHQYTRQEMLRGVLDNMNASNNGMKFVKKGALDEHNMRRYEQKKSIVELNVGLMDGPMSNHFFDGGFNPISPEVFKIMEDLESEQENLTGITKYSIGTDSRSLNQMLSLDTLIPMIDGSYKTNGDIVTGDVIVGSNGKGTVVTGAHKIHNPVRAYSIIVGSGDEIKAGGEHLWDVSVGYGKKPFRTVDTDELFDLVSSDSNPVFIPRVDRPDFTGEVPEFDAYTLGCWLGDGSSNGARITTMDEEMLSYIPYSYSVDSHQNSGNALTYTFGSTGKRNSLTGRFEANDSMHTSLRNMQLITRYGGHKHIPEEYFTAPYEVRLNLLRGLMDTDGCHHSGALGIFSQKVGVLLDDVERLIESLGWYPRKNHTRKAGVYEVCGVICNCIDSYQLTFSALDNPFRISRKADKYRTPIRGSDKQRVVSIKEIDIEPMRCLTVDAKDSLYCCGSRFTVTHNTATGVSIISSMSQRRLVFATQHIANQLSRVFKKWVLLISAMDDTVQFDVEMDLYVRAGSAGLSAKKGQDITNMLTALQPYAGAIDPAILTDLVGDLAETYELNTTAKKIRDSADEKRRQQEMQGPQQAQQQQQMQQVAMELEMAEQQSKITENHSKAEYNQAKAYEAKIDASRKMYSID